MPTSSRRVPHFGLGGASHGASRPSGGEEDPLAQPRCRARRGSDDSGDDGADESDEDLFGAAYENFTYKDSTADGVDGEVADGGPSDDSMELEARRLGDRLAFLGVVARLWKMAALGACRGVASDAVRNGSEPAPLVPGDASSNYAADWSAKAEDFRSVGGPGR